MESDWNHHNHHQPHHPAHQSHNPPYDATSHSTYHHSHIGFHQSDFQEDHPHLQHPHPPSLSHSQDVWNSQQDSHEYHNEWNYPAETNTYYSLDSAKPESTAPVQPSAMVPVQELEASATIAQCDSTLNQQADTSDLIEHSTSNDFVIGRGGRVKRNGTANKKERRRTVALNSAFEELRGRIPNVPSDTKLSKIKTLRWATSYIAHLMALLQTPYPGSLTIQDFKPDLSSGSRRHYDGRSMIYGCKQDGATSSATTCQTVSSKWKGRTGWPQCVWASSMTRHQHERQQAEADLIISSRHKQTNSAVDSCLYGKKATLA